MPSPTEDIYMEDTQKFLPREDSTNTKDEKRISFNGLSKEEVMLYANDPKWVRLRWALFALFWIVWIGMLAAAILIVVFTPKCPFRPKQPWWERETVYEVNVAKFKDSGLDGKGDLKGLVEKLEYFKEIGIKALLLKDIVDENNPKSVLSAHEQMSLKDVQKELKTHDFHVIVEIPYNYLNRSTENKEIIKHWLNTFSDGVRVSNIKENPNYEQLQEWIDVTNQVSKDTFESKYIAFESLDINQKEVKPSSLIDDGLEYDANHISSNQLKNKLTESLKSSYLAFEQRNLWPSFRIPPKTASNSVSNYKTVHALIFLIKGTAYVPQGFELDSQNSDDYMRWDNTVNCGFTSNKTLDLVDECEKSVQNVLAHGVGQTLASIYHNLTKLREEPSFAWGDITFGNDLSDNNTLSFVRHANGFPGYLVAANIGTSYGIYSFKGFPNMAKTANVEFFIKADNSNPEHFKLNTIISTERSFKLLPGELLVLKF